MRFLTWLLRAFLFVVLFAFALNNLQPVTVNWMFSMAWTTPLVIVVLVSFAGGAVFGVLAMTPSWWHHRRRAKRLEAPRTPFVPSAPATTPPAPDLTVVRDGL